jgi:acetyl esterase/lipase
MKGDPPMPRPADTLLAGVVVHRDLTYVSSGHPRHALDLYLPHTAGPLPLIVWIHGGAFRMGSKEDDVPLEQLDAGCAVAAINYRLSQHALFPAQIEDCKAAVRWLRAHADTYGLDPSRFASWGESAGGHLAAMLGTASRERSFEVGEHLEHSSRVQAVLDFFGPTDFARMDAQRLPDGQIHDAPDSPESQLVGGPIQERRAEVARANPTTYVTSEAPPFLIVHGDRDPLVPYGQSLLLVDALRAAGVPVTFYTVVGAGHGGFDDPQISSLVHTFLATHLKTL